MTDRYSDLKKVPKQPALRLLALANLKLETPLDAPATAPVDVVFRELETKGATLDILRLVAAALPPREAIWWSCLAAEDLCKANGQPETPSLKAARAWVLKPSDETREAARAASERTEVGDDTGSCALAVAMYDGKLGAGDMAQYDAPPGVVAGSVLAMNALALAPVEPEEFDGALRRLIDRGLDIARGGNGRLDGADRKEGAL